MDFLLPLVIGLLVGAVIGALGIAVLRGRGAATAGATVDAAVADELQTKLVETQASLSNALQEVAGAQARAGALADQVQQFREAAEAEKQRAQDESRVLQALAPVKATLTTMQQKVDELEQQRSRQHGELAQQLKTAAASEERLRTTADSLAAALRNNATRGVWGETQLRTVVEAAGMLQWVNFDLQSSIVSDAGHGRPDMVVRLPGGKSIAVDAKVPFNAYIEASAIPETAGDAELARRASLMKQHVDAVRAHVTALGKKAYWDGLDSSPEMVIAFIPSEALLASALEADPSILEFAFSKRVALASPVTLFSVLKTVAVSWQHDVVTAEAKALFDLSRELYSRISTTAERIDKLGRSLTSTVKDYNAFVGSMERQVLPSARKLNKLDDSKVIKALEPIEEGTRAMAAPEFVEALDAAAARERGAVADRQLDAAAPETHDDEREVAAAAPQQRTLAIFDAIETVRADRDV